jgi:hypothetical protein
MSHFGLRFYSVATFVGFGLVWASGIYLALIGYRGNPAECTSACLDGALLLALGYLLIIIFGLRAFRLFITRPGRITVKRVESLETGSGPEDLKILAVANELLSQRRPRRSSHSIQTLAWSDRVPWNMSSFKWQSFRKPRWLVLPVGLRNRLDLDDWRTLLNYSFLQNKPARIFHVLAPFARIALLVILFLGIDAALSFTLGQYKSALFGAAIGPLVIILFLIGLGPTFRKMFLRTDAVIASSLGDRKLLDLFEKIDQLRLPENENAEKREGWAARLWPMPNISERIVNLKAPQPTAQ